MNYIEIDKRFGIESVKKSVEKFNKLVKKLDGKNEAVIDAYDSDESPYFLVWLNFQYRNLFEINGSYGEDVIKIESSDYSFKMDLGRFVYVFSDWTEIAFAVEDCFAQYFGN